MPLGGRIGPNRSTFCSDALCIKSDVSIELLRTHLFLFWWRCVCRAVSSVATASAHRSNDKKACASCTKYRNNCGLCFRLDHVQLARNVRKLEFVQPSRDLRHLTSAFVILAPQYTQSRKEVESAKGQAMMSVMPHRQTVSEVDTCGHRMAPIGPIQECP